MPKLSGHSATGVTLALSLIGGIIAYFLHMPAAFLIGGAIAVSGAAFLGLGVQVPNLLRNTAFLIIGLTLGTNVAPNSLELIRHWPLSIAGLLVILVIIIALSAWILTKFFRIDPATAALSSFPGHLSFVLALAESGYGNPRHISVIQSMRVLLLTLAVPLVASFYAPMIADQQFAPRADLDLIPLLVLGAAGIVGGFVFQLVKIPAPFVLGPMVIAIAGKLMGLYDGAMPLPLSIVGYVVMGALIGTRFSGVKGPDFRRLAVAGVVVTAVCVSVVTLAALILERVTDMAFGQIWLGLAPGALESMGILGLALGFDAAFIAAHHTVRFFALTLGMPLVLKILRRHRTAGPVSEAEQKQPDR